MARSIENPFMRNALSVLAGSLAVYHILLVTVLLLDTIYMVAVDLMVGMILIFCLCPARKTSPQERPTAVDICLSLLSIWVGVYTIVNFEQYLYRLAEPTTLDLYSGVIALILALEATRRICGLTLPIIALVSILYCIFGNYVPGMLRTVLLPFNQTVYILFCSLEGIYGTVLIVISTIIFLFIIFASFMKESAAGDFFMDLSLSLVGRTKGGPAKLAVLSSSLFGMVAGAGTANVVATGNITIPLMIKNGFKPEYAGAIEAAASTGGQFLPPIMGAAVFFIAQITGVSYAEICLVSILPGILYMTSTMFYVHIEANKSNLGLMDENLIPRFRKVIKEGGHLSIPLILVFTLIVLEYSLARVAFLGSVAVILVSLPKKSTRFTIKALWNALVSSGKGMMMLLAAGASAGIILGVVNLTGIGLKFSSIFLALSGGNLFFMICLIGLASLIFGMGLPVLASYIVLAALAGPALEELGVPVIAAHLLLLWFSVDANVTPPVALASYVAAGIAKASIMKTSWESWKAAKGLYVVPFLMVYSPILTGNLFQKLEVSIMALFGLYAMSAALKGYLFARALLFERILLAVSALLLFFYVGNEWVPLTHIIGLVLFLCLWFINKKGLIAYR